MMLSPQEDVVYSYFRMAGVGVDVKIDDICTLLNIDTKHHSTYKHKRVGARVSRINSKINEGLVIIPGELKRTYRLVYVSSRADID